MNTALYTHTHTLAQVAGIKAYRLLYNRGVTSATPSEEDMTLNNPVMIELSGMWSTSPLPSFPYPVKPN